jgi:uncharacterized secreted protein with C-terminal beta-propeller domain
MKLTIIAAVTLAMIAIVSMVAVEAKPVARFTDEVSIKPIKPYDRFETLKKLHTEFK